MVDLGDGLTGEARELARAHAALAREAKAAGRRVAIISGGELSVTVRHAQGRGGRNQEYALARALALGGLPGVSALAADTDGIDGGTGQVTDPAGAVIDAGTLAGARHLDAQKFLDNNDATSFFEAAGGLMPWPHADKRQRLPCHPGRCLTQARAAPAVPPLRKFVALAPPPRSCLAPRCSAPAALADLEPATPPEPVGVAIGYQDRRLDHGGWWNISAQTCETLYKGTLSSRFYYIHAIDYDRGGEWAGKSFMCTTDKTFTIRGVQDCPRRGYKNTGFFEVDTQESKDWTIRLTDPSERR